MLNKATVLADGNRSHDGCLTATRQRVQQLLGLLDRLTRMRWMIDGRGRIVKEVYFCCFVGTLHCYCLQVMVRRLRVYSDDGCCYCRLIDEMGDEATTRMRRRAMQRMMSLYAAMEASAVAAGAVVLVDLCVTMMHCCCHPPSPIQARRRGGCCCCCCCC